MEIKDIYGNICPTLYTLSLISGKWRLPILWKLYMHPTLRFNTLKKEVTGITNMVLTQCLQDFEAHNIVTRIQYNEIPPRVEYALTDSGIALIHILESLENWGNQQLLSQNHPLIISQREHPINQNGNNIKDYPPIG